MAITVFITDDHPLAVTGLENMLLPFTNIKVTGKFHSATALLEELQHNRPDVLLLDILMPDRNGKEVAAIITKEYPEVNIIAVTSLDAPTHVKAMMKLGCSGYLLKNTDQASLVQAIETVYNGEKYIAPVLKEQMLGNMISYKKRQPRDGPTKVKVPHLTQREKEVLELLAKDYSNQEIADTLFLSIRTVENHRLNLLRKLDAKTPMGIIKSAIEMGLI